MADERPPRNNFYVYADFYSLQNERCMELIRNKIAENTPLTDEEFRIIAVEQIRGLKRLKVGRYALHLVDDPNARFTNQAIFTFMQGGSSIPVQPSYDHMTETDQQIMESISKTSSFPQFKSADHPDFDVR